MGQVAAEVFQGSRGWAPTVQLKCKEDGGLTMIMEINSGCSVMMLAHVRWRVFGGLMMLDRLVFCNKVLHVCFALQPVMLPFHFFLFLAQC